MPNLVADPDSIRYGGDTLREISEDLESAFSGFKSTPTPASTGTSAEASFTSAWSDLKAMLEDVAFLLVENLDDLGAKLKEQADKYETADEETMRELNEFDEDAYAVNESGRPRVQPPSPDGAVDMGLDSEGNRVTVYE